MMKKCIVTLLTMGVIMISLIGCGTNENNTSTSTNLTNGNASTDEEMAADIDADDVEEVESEVASEPNQENNENSVEEEVLVSSEDYSYVNDEGYIVFGRYEQDGDTSNGPEPIEWILMGTTGDRRYLISRYVLDYMPLNSERVTVNWDSCSLNNWLINDFRNAAFNEDELGQLRKVYCLGIRDIKKYYQYDLYDDDYYYGYCHELIAEATPYAVSKGASNNTITEDGYNQSFSSIYAPEDCVGLIGTGWWTCDVFNEFSSFVSGYGAVGTNSNYLIYVDQNCGVRPAIAIR